MTPNSTDWQERLAELAALLASQPQPVASAVNFVYGQTASARAEALADDLRAALVAASRVSVSEFLAPVESLHVPLEDDDGPASSQEREAETSQERGGDDLDTFIAESAAADPAFATAYDDAGARSALLRSLVERRRASGFSQATIAERMGTTQSAVSDLEAGGTDPRLSTLQRYTRAMGARLSLTLAPPLADVQVDREAHDEVRDLLTDLVAKAPAKRSPDALRDLVEQATDEVLALAPLLGTPEVN